MFPSQVSKNKQALYFEFRQVFSQARFTNNLNDLNDCHSFKQRNYLYAKAKIVKTSNS